MMSTPTPVPEGLIDSHVHLDFAAFDGDRAQVLARARAAGVRGYVVPAVCCERWGAIRDLAAGSDEVFPCYGLHPCFVAQHRPEHLALLAQWVERDRPVAIGECGLDFYGDNAATAARQRELFVAQLHLARRFELPVVLHALRAVDEVLKSLREAMVERGVVHSFSGSVQQAQRAIDQGLHIGLGGALTFERSKKARAVAAAVPLESLLLETDAPDQPGAAHRGERNEPAYLVEVLDALAALRPEPREVIARVTSANARQLFALPA